LFDFQEPVITKKIFEDAESVKNKAGTSPSTKVPSRAIERLSPGRAAANNASSLRITIFFSGISLFSLDKHSEQGYISALVEKYYVLSSSFFCGGS
jgi:hypothetical protein